MRSLPFSLFLSVCLLSLLACTATRRSARFFQKDLKEEIETSPVFQKGFTGFHLIDAETGREFCAVNADKYFTPASNTKILTLATCLAVLGDSVPRFRFSYAGPDTSEPEGLYFIAGTGDPTTLHPLFAAWQQPPDFYRDHTFANRFFVYMPGAEPLARYGPGWMWDDFTERYSPEMSALPVYGNMVRLCWENSVWTTYPKHFLQHLHPNEETDRVRRQSFESTIEVPRYRILNQDTCLEIPMHNPGQIAYELLNDSLSLAEPPVSDYPLIYTPEQSWYATPADTVYRRLMYQSDNFIAEQLMLVCAGVKFDTLNSSRMITWAKDSLFSNFPNPPRWVDGSGLSRYNLISPRFLTAVLKKLYTEQPLERLFSLFPAGGVSGTIEKLYAGPEGHPVVFAKTGTMSGVHCLSGYLVTKSQRVLAFSFMHNNFIGSNYAWKIEMQRLLQLMWGCCKKVDKS